MLLHLLLLYGFLFWVEPSTLLQQGLQALQQGHYEQARASLEEASKGDPSNPYIWSSLAETHLRLKETDQALAAAQKAEKLDSKNPIVSHALAVFYAEAGQFDRAAKLERIFAESPKGSAAALSRAAQFSLQAGDDKTALELAGKAAQADPQIAFEWAQFLLKQQQFSQAAGLLEGSLRTQHNDVQLTLALGVARYSQRRFDDAITTFLRVIRLDPTVEQPYLFVSKMLDQAGPHLDEILRDAEVWAKANPQMAKAQLVLAKVLLAKNSDSERAESLLRRSIELDANDWTAHDELGTLLADKRFYAEAAKELQRAIELDSKQPTPHYQLARVYDRLGRPARAKSERDMHETLIKAEPAPQKKP